MSEFKIIETQEQLDNIIGARLQRKEESIRNEYKDYDSLKQQVAEFATKEKGFNDQIQALTKEKDEISSTINSLNTKIAQYEMDSVKTRACIENGLPLDMAGRLRGETEEEIKADASALSSFFGKSGFIPPLRNPEANRNEDGVTTRFRELNPDIKL